MRFKHMASHFQLKSYIEKMWLFESSGKLVNDMKLIVPNGNLKLTISFNNGIVASVNDQTFTSKDRGVTLTGLIDVPVYLDVENDTTTETIGVEFKPGSAYLFFHFSILFPPAE